MEQVVFQGWSSPAAPGCRVLWLFGAPSPAALVLCSERHRLRLWFLSLWGHRLRLWSFVQSAIACGSGFSACGAIAFGSGPLFRAPSPAALVSQPVGPSPSALAGLLTF